MNKTVTLPQALEMAFIDCSCSWEPYDESSGLRHDVVIAIEWEGDDQYFLCSGGHTWDQSREYPIVHATRLGDQWFFDGECYEATDSNNLLTSAMFHEHRQLMKVCKARDEDRRRKLAA